MNWHLVASEYPPDAGGVAGYTAVVAHALAAAGHAVHVSTRGPVGTSADGPVTVHRVGETFGRAGLRELTARLDASPKPRRLFVQYAPHGYGFKAMNLPFAVWLRRRAAASGDAVDLMFHEVAYPWVRSPLRHNLIAAANRLMVRTLLPGVSRVFVTVPAWGPLLRANGLPAAAPVRVLPVPSTIPLSNDPVAVASLRQSFAVSGPIVGHFGTYGDLVGRLLEPAVAALCRSRADVRVLLVGRAGVAWRDGVAARHPEIAGQLVGVAAGAAGEISLVLQACDLLLQPYPDGVSARRTSIMAGLANGVAVVTNAGALTEPAWSASGLAVVPTADLVRTALDLLDDPARRAALADAGRRYYAAHFAVGRTLRALLVVDGPAHG